MEKEKYIIYIGGPCIDEYYDINYWPEEGNKFVANYKGPVAGGMIANAACVMAGYDYKTYCFYGATKGSDTDFLIEDLKSYNIDTSQIVLRDKGMNPKCLIFQGESERTILVVNGDPFIMDLNAEQLEFFKNAEFVYTALANLKYYVDPVGFFKTLKENGVKIVLDNEASTYVDNWEDYMQYCYFASMNDMAFEVYGKGLSEQELIDKILGMGVEVFVETLGSKGCKVITKDESFTVDAYKVDVVDTTGAGDTFNTSFTYALSRGYDLHKAAEFATAAAAMSITKQGPRSGVTTEELVNEFIKNNAK